LKRFFSLAIILLTAFSIRGLAQDTLPNFTITERGDKITISWSNPYPNLIQLNVQRSFDSLRNFTTVYSATSPELPQNGFTDNRMPTNRIFYRIFYVMEGGNYFFTPVKKVGAPSVSTPSLSRDVKNPMLITNTADARKVTVKIKDTIYRRIPLYNFRNFRDSILRQTRDTLFAVNDSLVMLKPYTAVEVWRPSIYVYANRDGYVHISLPQAHQKKFQVRFFEDNGKYLFEIPHVHDSPIVIDKSNFIHAGWFVFELFEEGVLKEKNKFYLPKDF
jgi:hypothetical protein